MSKFVDDKKTDLRRIGIAEILTDQLQLTGHNVTLTPNPGDLQLDLTTYMPMYPNKMSFVCTLPDGMSFKMWEILSINQSKNDLAWSLAAVLDELKNSLRNYYNENN